MANDVTLERGRSEQREALANLVQLYIYDFNEVLAVERRIGIGEDGRFRDDVLRLESYWTDADRSVWFIRVDGALAGFALLNTASHCGRAVDFNMGELFVARTYRRLGVGMRAAMEVITRHPGQWEIAVGARNAPAKAFWTRVIAAANVADVETLEGDGVAWTGPLFRFVAA